MDSSFGFRHFLTHLDIVGMLVLAALGLLSVSSWTVVVRKTWEAWVLARTERRRRAAWMSDSALARPPIPEGSDPWSRIQRVGIRATDRIRTKAEGSGIAIASPDEFVASALGRAVQEEIDLLERGMTLVATTSSAAPFVGLFGTVWSIYRALVAIGATGDGGLDKVAGPVGEALVMTGIGLAVAIPALLAYNTLGAWQRGLGFRMEGFAREMFAHLVAGPAPQADS